MYSIFKVRWEAGSRLRQTPKLPDEVCCKGETIDRRPCLTGGAKRLSIYLVGERTDRKGFFAGEKKSFH